MLLFQVRLESEEPVSLCAYSLTVLLILLFIGSSTVSASNSKFDDKIEASSTKMYFHYYGQLLHQQKGTECHYMF